MKDFNAKELLGILNQKDECDWMKAKGGHESSHSVMETVCTFADCETLKASQDLRTLKSYELLTGKGRGRATYYVPGKLLESNLSAPPRDLSAPPRDLSTQPSSGLKTNGDGVSTQPWIPSTPLRGLSTPPPEILAKIENLKKRENNPEIIRGIIIELCMCRPMKAIEITKYLNKGENYIKRRFLSDMITAGQLVYTYTEMINHPDQAYTTPKSD